jgi:hypothetical protein
MNKEDITYAIFGIVVGLVAGFFVANGMSARTPQTAAPSAQTNPADLPPNHPPIDPSKPVEAGPLGEGAGPTAPSSKEAVILPSLDPLPASNKDKRVEQQYKNIQVLKGVGAEDLMRIMFAFKASLGVECTHCHIKDQWDKDDKAPKLAARKMIKRVRAINDDNLGGRVTCYTCHRGQARPPQ